MGSPTFTPPASTISLPSASSGAAAVITKLSLSASITPRASAISPTAQPVPPLSFRINSARSYSQSLRTGMWMVRSDTPKGKDTSASTRE